MKLELSVDVLKKGQGDYVRLLVRQEGQPLKEANSVDYGPLASHEEALALQAQVMQEAIGMLNGAVDNVRKALMQVKAKEAIEAVEKRTDVAVRV